MIKIIPAISIYGQKVARINQVDAESMSLYAERPLDMALKLEEHGIKRIHLIDLEGAEKGRIVNVEVLDMIAGYTGLEIDFGGGITDDDDIRLAFEHGAGTVHAASIAARNRELFSSWIISYGRNKVTLSADSMEGKIATGGWAKKSEIDLLEHIEYYYNQGIQYVKCTDISRDGKLAGPAFDLYKKILERFPDVKLLASGGIRSVDDIDKLQDIGVYGAIFAKALYEGKIKMRELERFIVNG